MPRASTYLLSALEIVSSNAGIRVFSENALADFRKNARSGLGMNLCGRGKHPRRPVLDEWQQDASAKVDAWLRALGLGPEARVARQL